MTPRAVALWSARAGIPGAAGLKGPKKGSQGHPRLGLNPEAAGPKGADAARGAILPRVFPDDPARPYFWLPQRIEAAASTYCERHGVTFDHLLAQQLTRFVNDGAYQRRLAAWACTDSGWPEDLADCLAVAALRAARYHEAAEAALLNLSPEGWPPWSRRRSAAVWATTSGQRRSSSSGCEV